MRDDISGARGGCDGSKQGAVWGGGSGIPHSFLPLEACTEPRDQSGRALGRSLTHAGLGAEPLPSSVWACFLCGMGTMTRLATLPGCCAAQESHGCEGHALCFNGSHTVTWGVVLLLVAGQGPLSWVDAPRSRGAEGRVVESPGV